MREKDYLIVTAIGPDRIGLVQTLSDVISRHGCNIEDSKMAAFCGEFAVIINELREAPLELQRDENIDVAIDVIKL